MAKDKLVSYIKKMQKEGYSINEIKDQLYSAGYEPNRVEGAFNKAYTLHVKHTIHFSKTTLIVIIFLFLGIAAIFGFIYMKEEKPSRLMDLKTEILTSEVEQGGILRFNTNMVNFGSQRIYDIKLHYQVVTIDTNSVIASGQETKALETTASSSFQISIPGDAPIGDYLLKSKADYDKGTAIASSRFRIIEKSGTIPTPPIVTKPDCDDDNICTEDSIVDGKCIHTEIKPCCGNLVCEGNEERTCPDDCKEISGPVDTINRAVVVSTTNLQQAIDLCNSLQGFNKDSCFSNIALAAKNPNLCSRINQKTTEQNCYRSIAKKLSDSTICERISSNDIRDVCYAEFVTSGDYTVCDKFSRDYFKKTCERLRKDSELIASQ